MHQNDDISHWSYQHHDHILTPPLFYTSDDDGSDMHLDDESSGVFGSLFQENCWCVDDVEEAMSDGEDSSTQSNTYSDSASSCSIKSEDYEGFRYDHCEGI